MQGIIDCLNIYCIPPTLFLATGVSLGFFSLLKTKRQYENILFALICFWFSLIMPAFISHHIFKGNEALILKIEKSIHVFYVYGPVILILFTHSLVNKKNRFLEALVFLTSLTISLFVFTDYYFYGLWEYKWGYIGKGGIAFHLFGILSIGTIIYSFILSIKALKADIDSYTRLKIKFIMFAVLTIGILTLGNIPAMNGIDLYPPGNFAFIPILFMAWGIYRHDVIKINLYTKKRIVVTAVRIFVITVLLAMIPVCWWAINSYSVDHILNRTIPYGLPPLISFIITVFLAFLSLRIGENRNDSVIFSVLMLGYALLSFDIYLNCIITIPEVGLRISRFSHILVVFFPPLGMHLIRIVTKRRSENWLLRANYLISIILLFFTQSDYYLQDMYVYSWGLFAKKAFLLDVMTALSGITLIYNIVILVIAYRHHQTHYYRHRFLFLLFGFTSSAILSLGNIPAMNGYDIYPPGNYIFITASLFAIALFRYNRNELNHLIGSFLYYGITVIAILFTANFLHSKKADKFINLYSIFSLSGILLFHFFIRKLRDTMTGRHSQKLKAAFEDLIDTLSKSRSINELAHSITKTFFIDLFCANCSILLLDKEKKQYKGNYTYNKYFNYVPEKSHGRNSKTITVSVEHPLLEYIDIKHSIIKPDEIESIILNNGLTLPTDDPLRNSEVFLSVFLGSQLSAIILLGLKADSTTYSQDENKFLYELGIHLGPYIENAKILENLENTLEERTQELRNSEKKYRTILNTNNVGFFEMDTTGNIIFCNEVFNSFTGYTKEEVLGMKFSKFLHPDKYKEVVNTYHRIFTRETPIGSIKHEVIRKDGSIGFVDTTASLMTDHNDKVTGFRTIAIDITNRKIAEEALLESENNYQQLMKNINDCVFICKSDGHIKYVNLAITRLLHLSQKKFIGKNFLSFVHPDDHDRLIKLYQKQIKNNIETTYCEFSVLTNESEIKWVGQTVRMTKNKEGEIEFYGITRDVSDQKKEEDARRDLEHAKSRFFSNISHEIRTPLTLMLGPIESVLQGNYEQEIDNDFFKNLHRNTLSLLKLVNNLLDFSKIEAGKMILKVQEWDLVQFARQYILNIGLATKTKNITVEFDASADSINLFFDPQKMDKIFMNLLSNAIKYTEPEGTISITLKDNEAYCRIIVTDTGYGISKENINAIFDRFSQVDFISNRRNRGTGIGLALVKELVELHGGIIEVESRYIEDFNENHGTTFIVTIPKGTKHFKNNENITFTDKSDLDDHIKDYRLIGINESDESQRDNSLYEEIEFNKNELRPDDKKTILVVDDNEDMRNFLKILLQKQYRVLSAEDGEKGLISARNNKPDLILSDVMMPVMNGFDMTAVIKKDNKLSTTPVILLTAVLMN